MKRSAALLKLSQEHHTALVLAQRIAKAGDAAAMAALLASVPTIFSREVEPHFRVEEESLLPHLEAAGAINLVRRTRQEHRLLRELVERIASGDDTALKSFGSTLKAHVHFEEHELFAAAEMVLPAEFLAGSGQPPQPFSDHPELPNR